MNGVLGYRKEISAEKLNLLFDIVKWVIAIAVTALLLTLGSVFALLGLTIAFDIFKAWGRTLQKIFGIQVNFHDRNAGRYQSGGMLFVTLNQTSLTEVFIGTSGNPVPYRVVMNIEFALIPFLGWFLMASGGPVLIRQWRRQAKGAITRSIEKLRNKETNYWISIEGDRSPDGALLTYKKGTAVLAIASQATIIPVVYRGTRAVLPKGKWRIKPGKVDVIFCEAVSTEGLQYADRDKLIQTLRTIARKELGFM